MNTPRRFWTEEEHNTIVEMISQGKTHREIGEVIDRSLPSVRKYCSQKSIRSPRYTPWTDEENEWLAQNADKVTCRQAAEHIGKTCNAVALHASSRNLKFVPDISGYWSADDTRSLHRLHEKQWTNAEIGREIGRSQHAVIWKKKELGIKGYWRVAESGERFYSRRWERKEMLEVVGATGQATARRIVKGTLRSRQSVYGKMGREGHRVGQGRITFKSLADEIGSTNPAWLASKAREIRIISRKMGGNGMYIVTISSRDIVKIMDHILENPGMASFSFKKAKALRDLHEEVCMAGRPE